GQVLDVDHVPGVGGGGPVGSGVGVGGADPLARDPAEPIINRPVDRAGGQEHAVLPAVFVKPEARAVEIGAAGAQVHRVAIAVGGNGLRIGDAAEAGVLVRPDHLPRGVGEVPLQALDVAGAEGFGPVRHAAGQVRRGGAGHRLGVIKIPGVRRGVVVAGD